MVVNQGDHYLLFLLFLLASRKFYFFYLQVALKWPILLFLDVEWSRIYFSDDHARCTKDAKETKSKFTKPGPFILLKQLMSTTLPFGAPKIVKMFLFHTYNLLFLAPKIHKYRFFQAESLLFWAPEIHKSTDFLKIYFYFFCVKGVWSGWYSDKSK